MPVALGAQDDITVLLQVGELLGSVRKEDPEIGGLGAGPCAGDPNTLDGVLRLSEAGSVEERDRQARNVHADLDHVARGAGVLGGYGGVATSQSIENSGFSDIRRAKDGNLEPGPDTLGRFRTSQFGVESRDHALEQVPDFREDID